MSHKAKLLFTVLFFLVRLSTQASFHVDGLKSAFMNNLAVVTNPNSAEAEAITKTCFFDVSCKEHHSDYCLEQCCALKQCDLTGSCVHSFPYCILDEAVASDVEGKGDIFIAQEDNKAADHEYNVSCLSDEACKRNVTYCTHYANYKCCAYKQCLRSGFCTSFNPPSCFTPFCTVEECSDHSCTISTPVCNVANIINEAGMVETIFEFVDAEFELEGEIALVVEEDDRCIWDRDCRRDVTFCVEGCCAVKQCFSEGFCTTTIPACFVDTINNIVRFEETIATTEDVAAITHIASDISPGCIFDTTCQLNITYYLLSTCCVSKICPRDGNCIVEIQSCALTLLSEDQKQAIFGAGVTITPEMSCMTDFKCDLNVSYCAHEGCCASKSCWGSSENCTLTLPIC